jgi:ribosomal protein S18 acetylase RimI-like enzyme
MVIMSLNRGDKVEIVELRKDDANLPLDLSEGRYVTDSYYELLVRRKPEAWRMELYLKPLEKPLEKRYKGRLFEAHIEKPRAFAAILDGEQVGWIELGYDKWNNRMRVWEFLVKERFRRNGIGTTLMRHAIEVARQKGARMLVLETQSCDVPAIRFYLKQGFDLIGFDLAAYTNEDIKRKEIRLEFGLKL